MTNILHLHRRLPERPADLSASGIGIRTFAGPADIGIWLDLRNRAFGREKIGVRAWNSGDFQSEFLSKPWWQPERMWFADAEPTLLRGADRWHGDPGRTARHGCQRSHRALAGGTARLAAAQESAGCY